MSREGVCAGRECGKRGEVVQWREQTKTVFHGTHSRGVVATWMQVCSYCHGTRRWSGCYGTVYQIT